MCAFYSCASFFLSMCSNLVPVPILDSLLRWLSRCLTCQGENYTRQAAMAKLAASEAATMISHQVSIPSVCSNPSPSNPSPSNPSPSNPSPFILFLDNPSHPHSHTRPSRCLGAWATCRTCRPSAITAMPASPRSTRAQGLLGMRSIAYDSEIQRLVIAGRLLKEFSS